MLYKLLWLCTIAGIRHHSLAEEFHDYMGMFNETAVEKTEGQRPKARRQHISDFTDPETGKNPFLDLIEGPSGIRGGQSDGLLVTPADDPQFEIPLQEGVSEGGSEGRRLGSVMESIRPHHHVTKLQVLAKTFPAIQTTKLVEIVERTTSTTTEVSVPANRDHSERTDSHHSIVLYISLTLITVVVFAVLVTVYLWRRRANRFVSDPEFAIDEK